MFRNKFAKNYFLVMKPTKFTLSESRAVSSRTMTGSLPFRAKAWKNFSTERRGARTSAEGASTEARARARSSLHRRAHRRCPTSGQRRSGRDRSLNRHCAGRPSLRHLQNIRTLVISDSPNSYLPL